MSTSQNTPDTRALTPQQLICPSHARCTVLLGPGRSNPSVPPAPEVTLCSCSSIVLESIVALAAREFACPNPKSMSLQASQAVFRPRSCFSHCKLYVVNLSTPLLDYGTRLRTWRTQ